MVDFKFPDVAEGITEGKLIDWKVNEGDVIKKDQILCEMETDKSVLEIPSPYEGKITKLHFKSGDMVPVGNVLVSIDGEIATEETPEEAVPAPETLPAPPSPPTSPTESADVRILPKDRKLAKELGVDLKSIKKDGRVTEDDIRAAAENAPAHIEKPAEPEKIPEPTQQPTSQQTGRRLPPSQRRKGVKVPVVSSAPSAPVPPSVPSAPASPASGDRIKIEGVRGIIKNRMEEAWKVPHASVSLEFDATKLVAHRTAAKQHMAEKGIKLTYLAYVIRVVADALENFPRFNASVEGEEIVLKKEVNIGFAVDTDYGLVVPNIKECNKKTIAQIAKEIQELAQKARDKKLSPQEISGGTFTITNVGSFKASGGSGIINPPEVAILMIGMIKDGQFPLDLTFDHRILDGADAGRFLNFMVELLENPMMQVDL